MCKELVWEKKRKEKKNTVVIYTALCFQIVYHCKVSLIMVSWSFHIHMWPYFLKKSNWDEFSFWDSQKKQSHMGFEQREGE